MHRSVAQRQSSRPRHQAQTAGRTAPTADKGCSARPVVGKSRGMGVVRMSPGTNAICRAAGSADRRTAGIELQAPLPVFNLSLIQCIAKGAASRHDNITATTVIQNKAPLTQAAPINAVRQKPLRRLRPSRPSTPSRPTREPSDRRPDQSMSIILLAVTCCRHRHGQPAPCLSRSADIHKPCQAPPIRVPRTARRRRTLPATVLAISPAAVGARAGRRIRDRFPGYPGPFGRCRPMAVACRESPVFPRVPQFTRASTTAVSSIRLEKPHSLSYHANTRSRRLPALRVSRAATVAECGSWLKSTETQASAL